LLISNGSLVPDAYGDTTRSWRGQQFYYPQSGLQLTQAFASYASVYKTQPWIAALVNKIAYGTARLPLKVYNREGDGSRSDARETPFAKLLRNPNPRHDPFFFWLWTVSTHEVYGEALWVKIRPRPGAAPTQLWPLHPANVVTIRRNVENGADYDGQLRYRYLYGTNGDQFLEWPVEDIVHFKTYNPDDQVRGLSRLEPLRQTILNEDSARRASAAMWSNGGRPSFAVSTDKVLTDGAWERLNAEFRGLHQGVDNWGKIAILEEGLTPHALPVDAVSMQFIEARQISREEACGMFDVPPPAVHILDHATFSNITEQMRSVYRDTMAPRLGLFESGIDAQLRPDFDPQANQYAEFLMDEVLRGAFETRAAANQSAIFSGQRTPNEVRKQDNLPPLEGGDRLYINAGAIPLAATEGEAPTGTAIEEHPQAVKAIDPPDLLEVCLDCASTEFKTSPRGLCRSCEGKAARRASRKEIA
jgi:HK97 family phage portal protein